MRRCLRHGEYKTRLQRRRCRDPPGRCHGRRLGGPAESQHRRDLQNVYEAAREAGVRRVVYASSTTTVRNYELDEPYKAITEARFQDVPVPFPLITHESPTRPHSVYSCTKLWGEGPGETLRRHIRTLGHLPAVRIDKRARQARHPEEAGRMAEPERLGPGGAVLPGGPRRHEVRYLHVQLRQPVELQGQWPGQEAPGIQTSGQCRRLLRRTRS